MHRRNSTSSRRSIRRSRPTSAWYRARRSSSIPVRSRPTQKTPPDRATVDRAFSSRRAPGRGVGETRSTVTEPTGVAERLLCGVRSDDEATARAARAALDDLDPAAVIGLDEDAKLAFWIDIYNAAATILHGEQPDRYETRRWGLFRALFRDPLVRVAGHDLSLDGIEHGILRRSMTAWGLGYVPRLRPDRFERRTRVARADPRVHFALNCGAASCPPIAVYTAAGIDDQLDAAVRSYLDAEVAYDPGVCVEVPRLFLWYRGDFGGKVGVYEFLERYDAIEPGDRPPLSYADWDWSRAVGQFRD
ncbi:DUF547 domain-containing protein [Halobacteriales archaeon SW_7_68_16]|nr:MAG: DUF547 domain-containing protein [Halobacteriales archaeon SW_7_68_16]